MDNLSMIACVGKNLELGKNNDLIWHLPNDLKYFKSVTKGKTVIMGRRTFESLPGILPKRRNIVLQLPNESKLDGVEIFNSIPDILENIKDEDEAFIIGGASTRGRQGPWGLPGDQPRQAPLRRPRGDCPSVCWREITEY